MFQNGACYIRVSTDEQTEYSPDAQLRTLKDYANKNNIDLKNEHIYIDEGISGKRADKRPAFMKMIAAARTKPKPFDVILVHKFDRFARSREDSVVYKSLLKKEAGIKVISITESIEDDKFSVILEAMLEAMAEYYSLNLADEVKKGMTEKAYKGELQNASPFGYKAENGKLIILPDEAKLVRFIFEQFISRKMNMRQLAVYVNDLGVKSHRDKQFENRSVEYILNNPVYIGKLRWTPTGKAGRIYNHPDTIVSDSVHEPIISLEIWDEAQEVMKQIKQLYKPRTRTEVKIRSWLKDLVRCGNCGKLLTPTKGGSFQCNGYSKGVCKPSSSISIKRLEHIILEEIKEVFIGNIMINNIVQNSKKENFDEYDLLYEKLKKLDYNEQRIKLAYQEGIDTLEEYKINKAFIADKKLKINEKLNKLKELSISQNKNESINMQIESVYELLTDDTVSMNVKHKTANFLIENIIYTKQNNLLEIKYKSVGV